MWLWWWIIVVKGRIDLLAAVVNENNKAEKDIVK